MAKPLQTPSPQFCDANGNPYAGGTLATYIPGTTTPKDTWTDHTASALNTNPIVLDAAGRCVLFGDGEYRIILRDSLGNLVFDQWTTSLVSTFMQPVIMAPDAATARSLLGIDNSAVDAETERAEAAEANLQSQITAEVSRATAAETSLRNDLNAEIARAEAAESALSAQIAAAATLKGGNAATDATGHVRVTYPTAYPTGTIAVVITQLGSGTPAYWYRAQADASGFDAYCGIPLADDAVHPAATNFYWVALGN